MYEIVVTNEAYPWNNASSTSKKKVMFLRAPKNDFASLYIGGNSMKVGRFEVEDLCERSLYMLFHPTTIQITNLQASNSKVRGIRDSMRFGMANFFEYLKILAIGTCIGSHLVLELVHGTSFCFSQLDLVRNFFILCIFAARPFRY